LQLPREILKKLPIFYKKFLQGEKSLPEFSKKGKKPGGKTVPVCGGSG
jgi:hypothetical protein